MKELLKIQTSKSNYQSPALAITRHESDIVTASIPKDAGKYTYDWFNGTEE